MMKREKLEGLVHVYTGGGKGKTTASLGLALRALGYGLKVYMIQFMKGYKYGELQSAEKIPNFKIVQFGREEFVNKKSPAKMDIELAKKGFEHAKKVVKSNQYDVVILDCINVALDYKLIDLKDVIELIKSKPPKVELVLTGRYAPKEIIEIADYVTDMKEVKHPYRRGISARRGIDW